MTKKKSHEEEIRRGIEALTELGVSVDDTSRTGVPGLTGQLGKGRETDLAIAFLLGRIHDAGSVEALTNLEHAAVDKGVQREIRRSLYKLAQKGLMVNRPESGKEPVAKPILSLSPEIEAYLSSVDGIGGRLVWLAKPQAGSGIQLLQGMVSDREGLGRAGGAVIRRKELRHMAQDIKQQHGITMVSVPWEYADQILYEGFEKAKALGRSGVEEFASLRSLFNLAKPRLSSHPIYDRLSADEIRSGAWRELSRQLLDEPEFHFWILDEDWMKPYLEKAEAAHESRLVLNELQKQERLTAIVGDAVHEIFSGERGRIFERRMEDMALYLLETKREQQARLALGVALAIKEGDLGGLGSLDVTFLTGLIQKSLAFYLSRAKEKAADEPSLIVKP